MIAGLILLRMTESAPGAVPSLLNLQSHADGAFMALMYHNICADERCYAGLSPSITSYFVDQATFAEQLRLMGPSRCMAWDSLRLFYAAGAGAIHSAPPSRRPVLLTFDDGWRDAIDIGGPLLEQHGCEAVLFVTTGFLDRRAFLSRRDLSRLSPRLFHVGSHGSTHRMLSLLSESEVRAELSDSRKLLQDLCGREIDALSIPSGAVDRRVRRIAYECGYRFVFDSGVRINRRGGSPLKIGRIPVMRTTSIPVFRRYVNQRIGPERVRRALLHLPKRLIGLRHYERLRRHLLGEKPGQHLTHTS